KGATTVPFETAQKAWEVAEIVSSLGPITNPNMASDLTVASALAQAAVKGALANVEINLGSMKDAGFAAGIRSKMVRLQGENPRPDKLAHLEKAAKQPKASPVHHLVR